MFCDNIITEKANKGSNSYLIPLNTCDVWVHDRLWGLSLLCLDSTGLGWEGMGGDRDTKDAAGNENPHFCTAERK